MSDPEWNRKVFRLRKLPNDVSRIEAAQLLSDALGNPPSDVCIFSLAKSSEIWDSPSKVATLQFKSVPEIVRRNITDENDWSIPLPVGLKGDDMILDIHFSGMTVLNDVEGAKHTIEYTILHQFASLLYCTKEDNQLHRHIGSGQPPFRVVATSGS
jgi:hypothetical protein